MLGLGGLTPDVVDGARGIFERIASALEGIHDELRKANRANSGKSLEDTLAAQNPWRP